MLIDALWIVHEDYAGRTRPSVNPTPYIERTTCNAVLHFIVNSNDRIVDRYEAIGAANLQIKIIRFLFYRFTDRWF